MLKNVTFKEALEVWSKPERLVFVTSLDDKGKPRVMTVGWITRASFRPPMLAIVVGKERSMHAALEATGEFVVAVPGEELAKEALLCGTSSANDVDRFQQCQFIAKPGNIVKAPMIENCLANFECKIAQQISSGDHTIFIGEVVSSWVRDTLTQNLVLVGDQEGYTVLAEEGPYRVGIIR
jgi:flavin reductase (DIM6/NTAB) family NADH-FMN oxidoreductase RutF